jgi:hypothetical protein
MNIIVENANISIRLFDGIRFHSLVLHDDVGSFMDGEDLIFPETSENSKRCAIELKLTHLNLSFEHVGEAHLRQRLRIRVKEIEILDFIESSQWNKLLTSVTPDKSARPRETDRDMFKFEMTSVGDPKLISPELRIRCFIYPLQFHVDQDSLDFLLNFFTPFQPDSMSPAPEKENIPDDTFFRKSFDCFSF